MIATPHFKAIIYQSTGATLYVQKESNCMDWQGNKGGMDGLVADGST